MTAAQIENGFSRMLVREQFKAIGVAGVGNPSSDVAECLSYFRDHIYLGVNSRESSGIDNRARILKFEPSANQWRECYQSPVVDAGEAAAPAPEFHGIGSMAVFQGSSDREPVLYASAVSQQGVRILRSEDGENFDALAQAEPANPESRSLVSLTSFKGKLFSCAVLPENGIPRRTAAGESTVRVTDDPYSGAWAAAMEAGFGDGTNMSICCLAVLNDFLYASAVNPRKGFQLWKTDASGAPPYAWQPVLVDGAGRFNLNATAPGMTVFQGALYVGSGLPGMGRDPAHDLGPAACELIRVYPDDSWELVVGEPRFTPVGLQVPFSSRGPGFDDFYNSAVLAMAEHDGWLYAGTRHWKVIEDRLRRREAAGGFQLWRSQDGDNWESVTLNGFHQTYELGIRALLSTPQGLVLGTSNHAGVSRIGRDQSDGASETALGGCQVWLGRHSAIVLN